MNEGVYFIIGFFLGAASGLVMAVVLGIFEDRQIREIPDE